MTLVSPLLSSRVPFAGCFLFTLDAAARVQLSYETTISTVQNPAQTATRFSEPQLEQEREGHFAQSPPRRAETANAGIKGQMGAEVPQRRTLGRAARIKQGRDFAGVRREGQRFAGGCLIANWRQRAGAESRLGVITSGKIGGAVARNRARRLLRESFRLHQHELVHPLDLVLVARPSIAGKALAEVEKDLLTTLRKTGLLK